LPEEEPKKVSLAPAREVSPAIPTMRMPIVMTWTEWEGVRLAHPSLLLESGSLG